MVGRAYQSTEGLVKPVKAMVKGVSGFADVKGVKKGGNRKTRARDYPGLAGGRGGATRSVRRRCKKWFFNSRPGYGLMPKTEKDAAKDFDGLLHIGVAALCVLVGTSVCCTLAF